MERKTTEDCKFAHLNGEENFLSEESKCTRSDTYTINNYGYSCELSGQKIGSRVP